MRNLHLVKFLCYSGLIPFYTLAILSFFLKNFFIIDLFSIYSLVILSFLYGSCWLNLINKETESNIKLILIITILSPIFLILNEIFIRIEIKIFIYAIFYLIVFLIDNKFIKNTDYLIIRKNLTIQVVITHILLLISIYTNSV